MQPLIGRKFEVHRLQLAMTPMTEGLASIRVSAAITARWASFNAALQGENNVWVIG
ncbi:hypothetical protein [Variovorax arabinosiphilus]|uniref:hypothetical protein n=1 Tax=Variovorax arabinosiphilus TaxID=3053498 RepID=UPI002576E984|nr:MULTISPECIES: hypothetical protein [unclassified Variovorax]MDM0118424.1 hypothetical protein [Variovorax sp. J2L1-78]MDM0128849.1 hypothetical protein [Variovorax sp. J2L1-63]MDM0233365.1 hypothetical protein [Variovorax sp. J2R1-6]